MHLCRKKNVWTAEQNYPIFLVTVQRDFRPPVFFSLIEPTWATEQRVKIFSILVKNSSRYSNFKFENLTSRGSISSVSDTPESQSGE